jgi:hypothetical protein
MQARAVIVAMLCLALGACAKDHFAYVTQTGTKPDNTQAQQLRLAQITAPTPATGPAATGIATLIDTSVPDGSGLLTILGLWVSPANIRLLAQVDDVGGDFFDKNLNAFNMSEGTALPLVNELTVIQIIHRKTCPSAAFDAYLATLKSQGTPQAVLDGLDFSVPDAGPSDLTNLPEPVILGWIDDLNLALTWTFPLSTSDNNPMPLQDTFKVIVTWPIQQGAPARVACVAQPPTIPHPATALSADPTIRLNGTPVNFTQQGQPIPAPPAQFIAGIVPATP